MARFETEVLATDENVGAVADMNGTWIDRARSWDSKRRVVAKVEWHPGELCPRVGLDPLRGSSVTKLTRATKRVVTFYNQWGKAEQYIKEGKNAMRWTQLSCRSFRHNAVRLQLHALAYNLVH